MPDAARKTGRPPARRFEAELPAPPSVNGLWRSDRGRVHRSKRYVNWLRSAGWELKTRKPPTLKGAVKIEIRAGHSAADLDNLFKALLDLLVAHQVLADDKQVCEIRARVDVDVAPGRVRVTARETQPPHARPHGRWLDQLNDARTAYLEERSRDPLKIIEDAA